MDAPGNPTLRETPPSDTPPSATIDPAICARTNRHQRQTPWNWKDSLEALVDGQGKRKAGSVAIILRLNRPSMRFNDGPNDRETHPETFFFGRKKLIEELAVNLRGNPAAPVANAYPDGLVTVYRGSDMHLPLPERSFVHRVDGVAQQIN